MRKLLDATIEELLREVFSVRSVPRCYKQETCLESSELRQSPARKDVNREVERSTALEAVIRERLAKTQQTEKT
jgi:hypothetical protein